MEKIASCGDNAEVMRRSGRGMSVVVKNFNVQVEQISKNLKFSFNPEFHNFNFFYHVMIILKNKET